MKNFSSLADDNNAWLIELLLLRNLCVHADNLAFNSHTLFSPHRRRAVFYFYPSTFHANVLRELFYWKVTTWLCFSFLVSLSAVCRKRKTLQKFYFFSLFPSRADVTMLSEVWTSLSEILFFCYLRVCLCSSLKILIFLSSNFTPESLTQKW